MNGEFTIVKIKDERKAPPNGDCDTIMSHQACTSHRRQVKKEVHGGRGGQGYGGGGYRGRMPFISKAFKSPIVYITSDTFNTSQIKFAAQFTQSRKNIASYVQRSVGKEAYLVAQTIRTGVPQTIDIPPPVPANDLEADDLIIIREEVVRAVAKRHITLIQDLKKRIRNSI